MPRAPRVAPGGHVYHVLSRASGKPRLFRKAADFLAFYNVLLQAQARRPIRILGWCIMPNHWHFVVWPRRDGELSRFFGYLSLTHAARWQVAHKAVGTGRVYQSRFKSFMIQKSAHLESVLRYVEGNPLRAKLVKRAQQWKWSSLRASLHGPGPIRDLLSQWPIPKPRNWVERVNRPLKREELQAIRIAAERGRPLGSDSWVRATVERFDLQSTIRPRGRQPGWRKKKRK
ncbi:MAG: transposase [Tepidisphaeraceae bacterium]